MPKPDYKKATEELMKILDSEPELKVPSTKNRITDLTEETLGNVYQFTENDLLIISDGKINKKR
jgi:hypothetical protein